MATMSQTPHPPKSGEMPSSTDAEKGILCSVLLDPDTVAPLCTSLLFVDAFYLPAHQIIYSLVLKLIDIGGSVDFVSLKQALADAKELEEIGGEQCLSDLYSFVPSAA